MSVLHRRMRRAAACASLCVLGAVAALTVCVSAAEGQGEATHAASHHAPRVDVACRVDPAVELLSIVQLLAAEARGVHEARGASSEAAPALDHAYRRAVLARFGPLATHAAVETAARLFRPGATHIAATVGARLMPPDFRERMPLRALGEGPDSVGGEALSEWVALTREFARASAFGRFFAEHEPFYTGLCARVLAGGELGEAADAAISFYGPTATRYEVVLMPLVPFMGVAPTGRRIGPRATLTAFVGPAAVDRDEPRFRTGWGLSRVLLHEFSHQYVNPMVTATAPRLARSAALFAPARARLWRADRIASWPSAVTETVVRAAVAVMRGDAVGDSAMRAELAEHRALGFVFVDSVATQLQAWKADRTEPFARGVPQRLEALLARLAASPHTAALFDPPFGGGMVSALRGREADSLIFIVPTGEADAALQDSLHARVRAKARHFTAAAVLTDREALGRDLRAHTLWAIGTVEGNVWLRAHPGIVPATILNDRIEVDSAIAGQGLVFLTAVPNPDRAARAVLLTLGQRLDEVARGWWVLAADYAVVDGERVLARGTYAKQGNGWSFEPRGSPPYRRCPREASLSASATACRSGNISSRE